MKKLITILMLIFLIGITSATVLGTFQRGECVHLPQTCSNCTYNNISKLTYPNSSNALLNVGMTKDDTVYNYTFCDNSLLGIYIVNGFGDLDGVKTAWNYDYEITGTGFELTQSRSSVYIALLFILVILFIGIMIAIPMLPGGDNYDEEGTLLSINQLKYVRPILWIISWFLLLSVMFISSNIALAYLGSILLGSLFFKVYSIMMLLSLPIVVIWFVYIFYNFFQDKKMKEYLERGFT